MPQRGRESSVSHKRPLVSPRVLMRRYIAEIAPFTGPSVNHSPGLPLEAAFDTAFQWTCDLAQ